MSEAPWAQPDRLDQNLSAADDRSSEGTLQNAAAFLVNLVAQSPEKIIAVSTEMHSAFTDLRAGFEEDMASVGSHPFAVACRNLGIAHARSIPPHTKPPKIRLRGVEIR